jgi:RNA polymerase sigma-70 factor (ECF subfamily)
MWANEEERELIAKATSGDRVALERLLLIYYPRLSEHIAPKLPKSLQSVLSTDDILQQTFVQVFRDIGNFEPRSETSFLAWLRTITEHRLLDAVKALKRKKRGGGLHQVQRQPDSQASCVADLVEMLSARSQTASRSIARREAVQAVQVAIAALPEDQREAVRLRFLEEKSVQEVAAVMDRSPDAVRGLIHRAKQALSDALGRSSQWFSRK